VTVEETAEINLPIDNWVQFISRESYGISGAKVGEVTLFDLVKTSLRYRPDYLIVGEVRGEEAFVLFQAVATGHGGLCTIHGESLDAAVKRLTSPPMNVSESYIPLMNVAINIERVVLPKRPAATSYGRRVTYVWEIRDYNDYIPVFEWSPSEDIFYSYIERSILIPRIARKLGLTIDNLLSELRIRAKILEWLKDNGIRSFREVAKYINEFYVDKEKLLKKLGIEIEEEREVAVSEVEEELPSPPVEIDSIPSVEAQPSKIERPVVRRFPYDIAEDVMNKMYKVLKILMGRKGVYTDTDIKTRLNMDDIEFKKIIEVMLKHNLISIEKKRKYSYIRIRKKGIKVYNTLSSHLGK
ncbi:MAG TPA: protein kinase, partial [Thermoprotei archaeon]|nr:protein kinase [Thermoprotei archaeon]